MIHNESTAYYYGYQAYQIWYLNQNDPKPNNLFNPDTDPDSADEWEQGWIDASIDA
jgi:hypothetical protein